MNVTGPGSSGGLSGLDPRALRLLAETLIEGAAREPSRAGDSAQAAALPADRLSVSFDALTAAPLQHLLETIEQRLFPAAAQIDVNAAYSRAVRSMVEDATGPAAAQAKDAALKSVDKAAQAIEGGGLHAPRVPENLDPAMVLALATRMIETQQYPNYLRAAELGNTIVTWYEGRIPDVPGAAPIRAVSAAERQPSPKERRWTRTAAKLWRKAPLLVLLGGWLLLGAAGALILRPSAVWFALWGTGFPALIVLQFLLTTRGGLRKRR